MYNWNPGRNISNHDKKCVAVLDNHLTFWLSMSSFVNKTALIPIRESNTGLIRCGCSVVQSVVFSLHLPASRSPPKLFHGLHEPHRLPRPSTDLPNFRITEIVTREHESFCCEYGYFQKL